MYYAIGPLKLQTELELPISYSEFLLSCDASELNTREMNLVEAPSKPDLTVASKIAEHSLMIVWKQDDTWVFESLDHRGFLKVNKEYSKGEFFCTSAIGEADSIKDQLDSTIILQPLLQAMLECRMVYEGYVILHSACVQLDGRAIAFSAPSGTGKSERALNFTKYLDAFWISGDRPMIDPIHGIVYGVPWDGKEQIFVNTSVSIQAIVELRRGGSTYAREMTEKQKMQFLSTQLFIPMWDTHLTQKAFISLHQLIKNVPIYRLYCDISEKSIREVYDILYIHPEKIKKAKVEKQMKLKDNFEIVEIAGDFMAIPTGENMARYGGSVVLNEVSAFLLKAMTKSMTEEELLELMLNEYEIDRETASADLKEIMCVFDKLGLIER